MMIPILIFGFIVFAYGLVSRRLTTTIITGPIVFTTAGLILALALPFFLAGLWRYWRTGGFLLLTCFAGLSLGLFCFALYGSTRFRLPLEPFFILFAAAFLQEGQQRWGWRQLGAVLGGVAVANLLLDWNDQALRALVLELLEQWYLK